MATHAVGAVDARCPVCGTLLLWFGQEGRVRATALHMLPLYRRRGSSEGFAVCDDCGELAALTEMPLN